MWAIDRSWCQGSYYITNMMVIQCKVPRMIPDQSKCYINRIMMIDDDDHNTENGWLPDQPKTI